MNQPTRDLFSLLIIELAKRFRPTMCFWEAPPVEFPLQKGRSSCSTTRCTFSRKLLCFGPCEKYEKNHPWKNQWEWQAGWWLNQPIWKICSSKWVHLPQIGVKIKNIWDHHLARMFQAKTTSLSGFLPRKNCWATTLVTARPSSRPLSPERSKESKVCGLIQRPGGGINWGVNDISSRQHTEQHFPWRWQQDFACGLILHWHG